MMGWPRGVLGIRLSCRPTDRGSNPGLRTVYYFLPRKINITRGIPLAPKIISRGEIQGVKNSPKWGLAKLPRSEHADS